LWIIGRLTGSRARRGRDSPLAAIRAAASVIAAAAPSEPELPA